MKIRAEKSIINQVYQIEVRTEAFSETDRELMLKFGQPEVNVGGTATSGETTYALPDKLLRLRSDFPYLIKFDGVTLANAAAIGNLWLITLETAVGMAMTTLRANTDAFTAEVVTNV